MPVCWSRPGGAEKKKKKKRASRGLVRSIGRHVTLLSVDNTGSWEDRIKPGHEKILPHLPQSFVALVFSAARPLLPSSLPLQLHPVFRCFSKQIPEEKEIWCSCMQKRAWGAGLNKQLP